MRTNHREHNPMKMINRKPEKPPQPPLQEGDQPIEDGFAQSGEVEGKIKRVPASAFSRISKYLLARSASILVTIFIGVFITVVIANRGGQIDATIRQEVQLRVQQESPLANIWYYDLSPENQAAIDALTQKYEREAGLSLSFLPRHLLWTVKALGLGLGKNIRVSGAPGSYYSSPGAAHIILADLPHTLMLIGAAFLLLFITGIPLALYLYRKHGSPLDRLFTLLAPVSSIPSWVMGVILVLIFAAGLQFLPPGGMYDSIPSSNAIMRVLIILKHMILPVMAIFLSMFFSCIYAWKTFFMLYANEDYVDLAKAKGLPDKLLEKQYILRPTLPYILTNFTLLLVSFWQMTMALEKVFNWPGIGRLYITSLPNFNGESMFSGVMPVVVGIVVLFAYILGVTVLVLDVIYALVDPRVRVGAEGQTVQPVVARLHRSREKNFKYQLPVPERPVSSPAKKLPREKATFSKTIKGIGAGLSGIKPIFQEIKHYPTAIFGSVIILFLVGGSIAAVTFFPYNKLAELWSENAMTGKSYVPKLAKPVWINWFRKDPLPSSIFLDSSTGTAAKAVVPFETGGVGYETLTYTFDYHYGDFPQDLTIYFDSKYKVKRPFVTLTWITPDKREIKLDNFSPESGIPFNFTRDLSPLSLLTEYPHWQNWFIVDDFNATPPFHLLFSDPAAEKAKVLQGQYTLKLDVINFEAASHVDAELILLGKVSGWAGTDYLRRDLLIPLLWGMPFALALGLIGASLTTVFSMILAATGVYFGGWLDNLVQRLIEGVMILPVIAIGVILYAYFNMNIWTFLALIALLNVFGSPTKSFRAALLQIKDSPYIEWAKASGASNMRIILHFLLPNILPMLIPQLVALIPSYVFLEATLGIFGVKSDYPTWGKVIFEALKNGAVYGSGYWVLEPIFLLLLTGLAFAMLGFALERILNPRLKTV
jgi:peptide/nickel transport system permease protein